MLFCCCLLHSIYAQQQKAPIQLSPIEQKLEEAGSIKTTDPTKATEILESVFGQAKRRKNPLLESEAYFMLGEIYENIDQKELALQRYESAYKSIRNSKDFELLSSRLLALGNINLALNRTDKARKYFQECIEYKTGDDVEVRCREGLTDVEIDLQNYDEGLTQNMMIQQIPQYTSDSMLQSKVQARNSIIYSKQNRPKKAQESYMNSIQNIPRQEISEEDLAPIQAAKNIIGTQKKTADELIAFNQYTLDNAPLNSLPPDVVVEEQLQIASLYEEQGEFDEAEKYIAASRESIKKGLSSEKKAEIFKKAAEVNEKQGDYEQARVDYQRYTLEKDRILETKKEELNQLIAILKGQEKIDLLAKDVELEEKDAALLQNQVSNQRIVITLLSLLLLGALGAFYFIFKNVKAKRQANQLLLLKSLRTQMNPHFIFNALNSINSFISKSDERSANKFLTDFSRLMRLVLDHSQKDFIALDEELNLIDLYLKLEHQRFQDKFDFTFEKDAALSDIDLHIPPMLIQPFIENSIWHGLRYKIEKGRLDVSIQKKENNIEVRIKDDGIGRKKSQELKTGNQKNYKSEGLKNVNKRLALINEIYGKNYQLEIQDLYPEQEETGTLVYLTIPY